MVSGQATVEGTGPTGAGDGNPNTLGDPTFTPLGAPASNGQSRIYLGIHWAFDKTEGIAQGRRVANYIYDKAFRRRQ
jgi:hypothetical protein